MNYYQINHRHIFCFHNFSVLPCNRTKPYCREQLPLMIDGGFMSVGIEGFWGMLSILYENLFSGQN